MPLRARLLDMGEVGAVRAHSLRYAVAAGMGAADDAALLVVRTASSAITLGEGRDASAEVDLAACRDRRIPVLRLPAGDAAEPIDAGSLIMSLILRRDRAGDLGVPRAREQGLAWLEGLVEAAVGERAASLPVAVEVAELGQAIALTLCLGFDPDPGLAGLLHDPPSGEPGCREPGPPLSPAEAAEMLLLTLEERAGLEFVPSMPMPDELDSVYAWDQRLAASAGVERTAPAPGPAV